MRSNLAIGTPRKGFAFMAIGVIGFVILIVFMFASFFSGGGAHTDTLLGWGNVPFLSGIDAFITGVYNIFIYISLWVSTLVLLIVLIIVQVMLAFAYFKLFSFLWQFKGAISNIMTELLELD